MLAKDVDGKLSSRIMRRKDPGKQSNCCTILRLDKRGFLTVARAMNSLFSFFKKPCMVGRFVAHLLLFQSAETSDEVDEYRKK